MHKLFIRTRGRAYRPPVATELPDSNKLLISFSQWNEFPREHDSYFRTEEIGIALCVQEQIIIRIFERRLRRLAIDSSSSSQFLDAKESNGSFFLSFFFLKMKWYSIFISKIGVQKQIKLKRIEEKYSSCLKITNSRERKIFSGIVDVKIQDEPERFDRRYSDSGDIDAWRKRRAARHFNSFNSTVARLSHHETTK